MKEQAEVCEPGVVLDFDQSKKGISREGLTTSAEFIVYDIYLHIQRILCAIAFGMFCLDFIHIKMHPIIMGFFCIIEGNIACVLQKSSDCYVASNCLENRFLIPLCDAC